VLQEDEFRRSFAMKRDNCLICGSSALSKIIDLGNQPYADTFVDETRYHDMLPVYNLSCAMCDSCGYVQTTCTTSPLERYNMFDYSYTSSNSSVAKRHWKDYSKEVIDFLSVSAVEGISVCEIGSNDGFLLSLFKNIGAEVLGVDASEYLVNIANQNNIPTIQSIFDYDNSDDILRIFKQKFDLVMANNVFNHSDNPVSFSMGVGNILKDGGFFVFEVPYWKSTIDSHKIDQIYHEHVSYFTAKSVKNIMEKNGFEVCNIKVVDYHGGSLRVYARKSTSEINHCQELFDLIRNENYLYSKDTYLQLNERIRKKKLTFLSDIYDIKNNKNAPIIAIGAAAKGNTFLNFMNLDSSIIDFVTDSSVHKQGKYTPLTNIKIVSDDILLNYDEVYAIILSWNLSEKIKDKLRLINKKIKFINFYEDYV
jgi:2-polyprenyl-3-methyl-5-hydroxy-6-metoxy-1,4-benzoquinol methylase